MIMKTILLLPFLASSLLFSESINISIKSQDCSAQVFKFLNRNLQNKETFFVTNQLGRRDSVTVNAYEILSFDCYPSWSTLMNEQRVSPTKLVLLFGSFSWVRQILECGIRKGFLQSKNKVIGIIDSWDSDNKIIKVSKFIPNLLFIVKNPSTCDLKLYNVPQNSNKMVIYRVVPSSKLKSENFSLFPSKFLDFKDETLRVCYNIYRPYVYEEVDGDLSGIDIAIIKELARYLKFKVKFVTNSDGKYGKFENGTWNGLVKKVMDGEADIGISMMLVTESRNMVIDYTEPYTIFCKTFVSPLPASIDPWNVLMKPFTWPVWVSVIVSVLVSTVAFKTVKKLNAVVNQINSSRQDWRNNTQFIVRCLLKQGVFFPQSTSSKIYALTWLLCSLILTSSYAGLLTGFLTAPIKSSPITTTDQLLKTSIPIGIIDYGGSEEEKFKSATEAAKIWEKSFRPTSFEEAFEAVMSGDIIFLSDLSLLRTANFEITKGKREDVVTFGKDTLYVQPAAFIVQKYSNLGPGLTNGIIRLNNGGLVQKWIQSYSGTDIYYFPNNTQSQNVILSLQHLRSGFYVLLGGLCLSVFSFLLERRHCCKI